MYSLYVLPDASVVSNLEAVYVMKRPRLIPMVMAPTEKMPMSPIFWRRRRLKFLSMKKGRQNTVFVFQKCVSNDGILSSELSVLVGKLTKKVRRKIQDPVDEKSDVRVPYGAQLLRNDPVSSING